jgi:hypothetical protein
MCLVYLVLSAPQNAISRMTFLKQFDGKSSSLRVWSRQHFTGLNLVSHPGGTLAAGGASERALGRFNGRRSGTFRLMPQAGGCDDLKRRMGSTLYIMKLTMSAVGCG